MRLLGASPPAGDTQPIGCLTQPCLRSQAQLFRPDLALLPSLSPHGQAGTQQGSTMCDQLNSLSDLTHNARYGGTYL